MEKMMNSFYLSKYTFIVSMALSCLGIVGWFASAGGYLKICLYAVLYLMIIVLLFMAYKNGEINAQKMLMGSLLILYVHNYGNMIVSDYNNGAWDSMIYSLIVFVLAVIVFAIHLLQQMDHSGKSESVSIGQISGLIIIVVLGWDIYRGIVDDLSICAVSFGISVMAAVVMIICMETRIAEYKKIRDTKRAAGCWTDEAREEARKIFKI